ncbi:fluoride efflux transporter CrcB [Rathayibacter sp. VKM Ac-2630]|uniref:fluoride efflux transporter CrcB n=1 Tax=Rathayibacter sp. VKM Ac-2630 TaxID=1938617 RepID=UPI000B9BC2EC|nr:fluoride efflux transporter CrcB [Rathayibacter sp. VKM Ac-2630]
MTRPLHLRAGPILLVAVGGSVGTAARYATALALPPVDGLPLPTIAVNLVGAFLLGVLLESLARRGPDDGGRRTLRLLLGTGVLGGFTTYSAFSLDTAELLAAGRVAEAALAVGITLVLGTSAAVLGILLADRRRTARPDGRPHDPAPARGPAE